MSDLPNITVYTAIFGDISDNLFTPIYLGPGVDYIAFVDTVEPFVKNRWQCVPAVFADANPRRRARHHKTLSHVCFPDAQYTLWVDGSLTPTFDPRKLITSYLTVGTYMSTFKHPERQCVYQEVEACVRLAKDDVSTMREQINRYRQEGYPYRAGLAETTALLRQHNAEVKAFNEMWWAEIAAGSCRDQLSFNVVAWRKGLRYSHMAGHRTESPFFYWRDHRKPIKSSK